ncbi:MAG: hypothetical protein JF616_02615 [Fibrobacteres bacterium]|nr:hypothetical protein [Fibrobacterota bacterium]
MTRRIQAMAAVSILLAIILPGCDDGNTPSVTTPPDSAATVPRGTIRDGDGHAVEGAEIRVFPIGYLPQAGDALAKTADPGSQAFRARTDAEGHFALPALTPGLYNVLAMRSGDVSLRDSVFLPSQVGIEDTLRAPASLSGRVELQPGDDPRGFAVQVVGLPYRVGLDTAGTFSLTGLPAGHLRLRVARDGASDYLEGNLEVTLVAGRGKSLEDPLSPVYLGVPAVRGVKAIMDTATGVVTLTWSRPNSPLIDHYVIVRENAPLNPYNPYWFNVDDTVFNDTLFPMARTGLPNPQTGLPDPSAVYRDSSVAKVQYRVAAAGINDLNGPFAERIKVEAPQPWTVTTLFSFGSDSSSLAVLQAGESGQVSVSFSNPTRKIKKLEWKDAAGHRIRMSEPDARQGRDTLGIDALASGDSLRLRIEATDASGSVWKDSLLVLGAPWKRLVDRPIPAYGMVGRYQIEQPMAAVGGKVYVFGSRGSQSHTAATVYDPASRTWKTSAEAPALGTVVAQGGKIYMAASNTLYAYSPPADAWDSLGTLVSQPNTYAARPLFAAGSLLAIGNWQGISGSSYQSGNLYDPDAGSMSVLAPGYGSFALVYATAQKAYLSSGYYGLASYAWETGSFQSLRTSTYGLSLGNSAKVEINGEIYFVTAASTMQAYDEKNDVNQTLPGPGFAAGTVFSYSPDSIPVQAYAVGGRIIAFAVVRPGWVEAMSFRPGDSKWKREIPLPIHGTRIASAESAGTVYVLGYYGKDDARAEEPPSFYAYPALP